MGPRLTEQTSKSWFLMRFKASLILLTKASFLSSSLLYALGVLEWEWISPSRRSCNIQCMCKDHQCFKIWNTVEALISRHYQDSKMESVTRIVTNIISINSITATKSSGIVYKCLCTVKLVWQIAMGSSFIFKT